MKKSTTIQRFAVAIALLFVTGQECISLVVFAVIANFIFPHEQLHWNHAAAALCLVGPSILSL